MNRVFTKVALGLGITFVLATTSRAQIATPVARTDHPGSTSLSEIRDKHRALLVVFHSAIVNAGDNERPLIDMVLRADPHPRGRIQIVYGTIAKKLNAYIRKYQTLSSATELADADYVIFFNLLEYRRILDVTYPYGELFVIVKGVPELMLPPRIVWRSRKVLYAGDAISDLIHELKQLRNEN